VAFILAGQVTLIPQAMSSTVNNGHLRTEVPVVPDAPIGHFRLTLYGGNMGYLANTQNICAKTPVVQVRFVAQNGRTRTQRVPAKTACGSKAKTKRK
jgi:hypothetical protein